MTSLSNSFQSPVLQDECFRKNYSCFLDFTRNYERMVTGGQVTLEFRISSIPSEPFDRFHETSLICSFSKTVCRAHDPAT